MTCYASFFSFTGNGGYFIYFALKGKKEAAREKEG